MRWVFFCLSLQSISQGLKFNEKVPGFARVFFFCCIFVTIILALSKTRIVGINSKVVAF